MQQNDQEGFTLFELLIVMVMIGVLAAIGLPSLIGLINAGKVSQAQEQVQGILRGAQRQAIRRAGNCEVKFDLQTNPVRVVNNTVNAACLTASSLKLPRDVKIATNLTAPPRIPFNFKGRYSPNPAPPAETTIVFYSTKAKEQRCLVMSLIMTRSGDYQGNVAEPPDPTQCKTTANTI